MKTFKEMLKWLVAIGGLLIAVGLFSGLMGLLFGFCVQMSKHGFGVFA